MSETFHSPKTFDSSRMLREWIVPAVLIIVAMVGARWAVVGDLNMLAATSCLIGGMALATALVSPRAGMYLLIFSTGYLDYFKRFTVVMDVVSLRDVAVILSIAPLIFVCVVAGLICHAIFRRITIRPLDRKAIWVILCIMAAGTVVNFRDTKSVEETLKAGANSVGYVPLLVVIGLVFKTPAETAKFLKHAACILIPVPLYAVWQQLFGPSQVEYEYLKTGLTSTVSLLMDTRFRPFSTMASPHPLSVACASWFILCLIPKRDASSGGFFPWLTWRWHLMGAIFLLGCFATFVRSGWADAMLALAAFYCFQRKLLTKLLYFTAIISLTLLIWNAKWIEENLGAFESYLPTDSAMGEQAFRLGTLGDRLNGWQNILTSNGILRPFGVPLSERDESTFVHDQIGQVLVNYGYAGFLVIVGLLAWVLVLAHTMSWRQKDELSWRMAIVCLSAIFGMLASGAMFGGHTSIFPVNVYFWMMGGILFQTLTYNSVALPGSQPTVIEPPHQMKLRREPRSEYPGLNPSGQRLSPRR